MIEPLSRTGSADSTGSKTKHTPLPQPSSSSAPFSSWRSILFYLRFGHVSRTLDVGVEEGKVEPEDLPDLFPHMRPSVLWSRFKRHRLLGCAGNPGLRLMLRVMVFAQPTTFGLVLGLNIVMQLGQMARPLVLQVLLAEESPLFGTLYVALLVALQLFHVVVVEHWYYADAQNSANTRALLMMGVFRCGLQSRQRQETEVEGGEEEERAPEKRRAAERDVGELTNLMATDADRIAGAAICLRITNWTLNTLRLPYTIWMLYSLLGQAGFVGVAAVVAVHIASHLNGQCMAASMGHIQVARDEKSSLASHMLKGFRLIRLHGCEAVWQQKIEKARERELECTVSYRYLLPPTSYLLLATSY